MTSLYLLLFGSSFLGIISGKSEEKKGHTKNNIVYIIMVAILICFAGLRGGFNDTYSYINSFSKLSPFSDIDWSIGSNPFFIAYESVIKKYITESPNGFLFISSAITVGVYFHFIKKHSIYFGYSVFVAIAMGVYGFTMAAVKQTLATAIALIAMECYYKRKKIFSLLLLFCAVMIHPYVIVFIVVPFLQDGIWNKKSLLIILGTFIAGSSFSVFMESVLIMTEAIGENYSIDSFATGTGVNIIRVLVYCVVPALSFVFRKEIREANDRFLNCAVNLSLLTTCFTVLSTFGGAVAIARLARYFDIFQCIVLPYILFRCVKNSGIKQLMTWVSVFCFCVYYYFYYKNYIVYGWFTDYFNHISVFDFIQGL